MTVIDDPAAAGAAGRCVIARSVSDRAVTNLHPRPCGWCDYPLPDLSRLVEGFNAWAGSNSRSNTFAHHELRLWSELPRAEQDRLITEAQAFEPAPAAAPVEEGPAWLR
jgi:hypothetical protein